MKLLYITTNIGDSGGVSRILSVKLNYLIKEYNYNISVLNTNAISREAFYDFDSTIKFYHLKKKVNGLLGLFTFIRELKKICLLENLDVIVICDNGLKGGFIPLFIDKSIRIIYERHNSKKIKGKTFFENVKLKISNQILNVNKKRFSAFVILNKFSMTHWGSQNIVLIPNPLWFKPRMGSSLMKRNVVVFGRNAPEKQYSKLLFIWKKVVDKHPDWQLKIIGREVFHLEYLTIELGIKDQVSLLNPVKDISTLFLEASIYLNTSKFEEFGLSVLEAMAFGLPVIGFNDVLGLKELVVNDLNGFLVEKDNLELYSKKIIKLIEDTERRKEFGNHSSHLVRKYDLETIMSQWNTLFNSI